MRGFAAAAALVLLAVTLSGCASPFTPYSTFTGPEIRASIAARPYDSDGDNKTDGIALTLQSATPAPPLVGSDVVIDRNGDTNVTVWRCPQREARLCVGNHGVLSWDTGETVYIRGVPGVDRLNIAVRERFVYNTTVRVETTRDTEVWAVFAASAYDSNGNGTADGLQVSLIGSDKAPFAASEIHVIINKIESPIFSDPVRRGLLNGPWSVGTKIFAKGFVGENHLEVVVKDTRYDLGTYVVGE